MKSTTWLHPLGAVAALCAAFSGGARAQTTLQPIPPFALEQLELDPAAIGSLVVGSGQVEPEHMLRLTAALHYEHNPLVLVVDGQRAATAIEHRFTVHLLGAFSPHPRLQLGLRLPYLPRQAGNDISVAGYQRPNEAGFGEPTFTGRFAILRRQDSAPFDLAGELGLGLPLGGSSLGHDDGPTFIPKVMASAPLGPLQAQVELGSRLRKAVTLAGDRVGSELSLSGAVSRELFEKLRLELALRGTVPFTAIPFTAELLAGARWRLLPILELFVLGGPGLRTAPGTPAFRVLGGAALVVPTFREPPPALPPPPAAPPPPPPNPCEGGRPHTPAQCPDLDDDGDGILNKDDACPLESGVRELKGCPIKDRDGDGVPDHLDACPDEPGLAELKGCPAKDSDGDGIPDHLDACPNEKGVPELKGCPVRDRDGDSVPDDVDACPDEPGPASNGGCPLKKKQLIVITKDRINLRDSVYFDVGKPTIQQRSNKLLDQVAEVLKQHPEISRMVIEGHTDNQGKPAANLKLSQARAGAVRDYLARKGVEPARLTAQGFGAERPISSNKTGAGRSINRRVEFHIVHAEQAEPAAGAPPEKSEKSEVKP